jgi:hypothetical protein
MPGHPDWAGTALTHGIDIVANGFGVTMAGGQSIAFPPFTITRPGYLCNIAADMTAGGSTDPRCVVDFGWYESTGNTHFGHEAWVMPAGAGGNDYAHTGRGPTKGQLLQLTFTNADPLVGCQATFWLAETTQHASRDDIRLHSAGSSPVWTNAPGLVPIEDILADTGAVVVPANSSQTYLLPLYSGQASLFWSATGQSAANVASVEVVRAPGPASHSDTYFQLAGATPFRSSPGLLVTLPRAVCLLVLGNTGTSPCTFQVSMYAQEYTS